MNKQSFISLSSKKTAPKNIRLFKFGENETTKGTFLLTEESSQSCIEAFKVYGNKLNIDYNHQQLSDMVTPEQGISAGTYDLEIKKDGLYAVNILWTARAKQQILDREYLYISPAFLTNDNNEIVEIINFALTNLPATLNMTQLQDLSKENIIMNEEQKVEELECGKKKKLEEDVSDEEVLQEMEPVQEEPINQPEEDQSKDPMEECFARIEALEALVAKLMEEKESEQPEEEVVEEPEVEQSTEEVSSKVDTFDEASKLSEEVSRLKSELESKEREEILSAAIKEDKITPSQRVLFKGLEISELKEELSKLPKLGLLNKISDGLVSSGISAKTYKKSIFAR